MRAPASLSQVKASMSTPCRQKNRTCSRLPQMIERGSRPTLQRPHQLDHWYGYQYNENLQGQSHTPVIAKAVAAGSHD